MVLPSLLTILVPVPSAWKFLSSTIGGFDASRRVCTSACHAASAPVCVLDIPANHCCPSTWAASWIAICTWGIMVSLSLNILPLKVTRKYRFLQSEATRNSVISMDGAGLPGVRSVLSSDAQSSHTYSPCRFESLSITPRFFWAGATICHVASGATQSAVFPSILIHVVSSACPTAAIPTTNTNTEKATNFFIKNLQAGQKPSKTIRSLHQIQHYFYKLPD